MRMGLIIGCPRSGTSILGELVAAHPQVTYIFEAKDVWEQAGIGENESHRLDARHATPKVVSKIRKWFEKQQRSETAMVVEKSPRNALRVPFLRAVFPEAKFIHVVRDGRDVACSLSAGINGEKWRHAKPTDWRELQQKYDGPLRCAHVWRRIVEQTLEDLQGADQMQLSYQDFVLDPQSAAKRVLEYLELPASPRVSSFCQRIQDETAGSYHALGQLEWYREDHSHRLGRWRSNLSTDEQRAVNEALWDLLVRLGFEKGTNGHSIEAPTIAPPVAYEGIPVQE